MSADTPAYVGICKACNGLNAAMVDDGTDPKGIARFVAEITRDGHAIERKTVACVRESARDRWCTCHKRVEKPVQQEALSL